jgi:hypothetical protein
MKSTVRADIQEEEFHIIMDKKIDDLRRSIWRTIFKDKGSLSDCDVAMALGLVQYELIHHSYRRKNSKQI